MSSSGAMRWFVNKCINVSTRFSFPSYLSVQAGGTGLMVHSLVWNGRLRTARLWP